MTAPVKVAALSPALCAALVLAGCGGGSAPAAVARPHLMTPAAHASGPARLGLDGHGVTIHHRPGDIVGFVSPTRNIGCVISLDNGTGGMARCDIAQADWRAPTPRPTGCDGDYGGGLDVQGGNRGEYLCATDSALGDARSVVLAYGQGYDVGQFRCVSAVDGMRCENRDTGHGFWISRRQATLF